MKPPLPSDVFSAGWEPPPASGEGLRRWGIGLFILTLAVLFAATLIAYVTIRFTGPGVPQPGTVHAPSGLWYSTGVLLACGVIIAFVQHAAKIRSAARLRLLIPLAWAMSVSFLTLQTPSLWRLAQTHLEQQESGVVGANGLLFTLITLHALHVVGGLIPMTRLLWVGFHANFTPADIGTIRSCAAYWHFLEAVWVTMFATFLIVR